MLGDHHFVPGAANTDANHAGNNVSVYKNPVRFEPAIKIVDAVPAWLEESRRGPRTVPATSVISPAGRGGQLS
jgi:hypothetical protein